MNDAHIESLQLLVTLFHKDMPQPLAFGPGLTWAGITTKICKCIPTMLHHHLMLPP